MTGIIEIKTLVAHAENDFPGTSIDGFLSKEVGGSMPFKSFRKLEIPDVIPVEFVRFSDERGFFAELYKRTNFLADGIPYDFVQVNQSFSRRGVFGGVLV